MAKELTFLRHAKTKGNITDPEFGIKFIGRYFNYDIILPSQHEVNQVRNETENCTLVLSSPSPRCKQSLELITENEIIPNENLHEINYGDADGLFLNEMQKSYPYLFDGWKNGQDPRFPNGENSQDVFDRYQLLKIGLIDYSDEKILLGTHNVFLRAVVGDSLGISMKDWFKINIPHFEPLKFELSNKNLTYKGSDEQKVRFLKNF